MNVQLTILGDPVPYKRERINMRAVARWMRVKMRGNPYRFGPLTYTPSECTTWRKRIARLLPMKHRAKGKISIWVTWCRDKPWSDSVHRLRPDGDNILKNLLDGLQDALIEDDAYVCDLHITQVFDAPVPLLRVKAKTIGTKEKPLKWCIAPEPKPKLAAAVRAKIEKKKWLDL